jgi:clan AA aspartic protease (TIGR02281 family)
MMKACSFIAAAAIGLAMADSAAAQANKCQVVRIAEWPVRAQYYRPVVDGTINGQKIGILLDTGATQSLVRRSATTRLGLTRYDAEGYRVFGSAGETPAQYVHIDEFRIGEAARKNWRVLVVGEHDFGDDIAVLLGDDFFRQIDVEFDLANKVVRLYETKDCESVSLAYWATDPAGAVPIEGDRQIELTVAVNGKPLRALLDSGSGYSVLTMADAAQLGATPQTPGVVAGGCFLALGSKREDSWIATFESFAVGNEIIRNPRIRFADLWRHVTYTETGVACLPALPVSKRCYWAPTSCAPIGC